MSSSLDVETVNSFFNEYEIYEFIAEGGQKRVYRGESNNGEKVVIKLLETNRRPDKKRAEREIRSMLEIENDTLVELKDSFELDNEDFEGYVIVEEYIEGLELREKIEEGSCSVELGLKVLSSVLDVLEDFNRFSIIHRDIKPSNIMIEPNGNVRLLDVGIARFTEEKSITPSFADRGPGTPQYSSPEQLSNDKDLQDIRSDIFSLGITGFEAITGSHPFDVDGQEYIGDAIEEGDKVDISEYLDSVDDSEKISSLLESMMATDRYERPRKPEFAEEKMRNEGII